MPEFTGDSYRGVLRGVRNKARRIDLNFLLTSDDVIACTHWPRILDHGFEDPSGRYGRDDLVSEIPWEHLREFRTPRGGYRVRRAEDIIPYAVRHGLDVEFDAKDSPGWKPRHFRHALDLAGGRLIVKAMNHRAWVRLDLAHRGGARTMILLHEAGIEVPRSYQGSLDYFRGFPPVWR